MEREGNGAASKVSIKISDLPPEYQRQALEKLAQEPKQNKHRNIKTERKGVKFDSKHEAERFEQLLLMLDAGVIRELKLQETFTLQNAYTTPEGKRIRAITYKADFTYINSAGQKVVEDAKSPHTRTLQTYRIKKKMMIERLGIDIVEV